MRRMDATRELGSLDIVRKLKPVIVFLPVALTLLITLGDVAHPLLFCSGCLPPSFRWCGLVSSPD